MFYGLNIPPKTKWKMIQNSPANLGKKKPNNNPNPKLIYSAFTHWKGTILELDMESAAQNVA